jgi:hypothetical protein
MCEEMRKIQKPGIYLIIDFEWPNPSNGVHLRRARELHDVVQEHPWVRAVVASSGGIGPGPGYTWVFWLEDYAALDRLLRSPEDEVARAYRAFFSNMMHVTDKIREEVLFL